MSSKTAWFPFYIGDYQTDTMHLSCEQHGAYFLLMLAYYRRGTALPDDDTFLASTAKLTRKKWHAMRPVLVEFFHQDAGLWRHKRIETEIAEQKARHDERSRSGAKGAASKDHNRAKSMQTPLAEPDAQLAATSPVQNGRGKGGAKSTKSTSMPHAQHDDSITGEIPARTKLSLSCPVQIGRGKRGLTSMKSMAPDKHISQGRSLLLTEQRDLPSQARDATPPLPSRGDGVAALRAFTKVEPLDEAERAEGVAMFDRCKAILLGKRVVFDSESGAPVPPDPRILEFRATLLRLNTLTGERLAGEMRLAAWDAIGRADAIGDPDALPPELTQELAALASMVAA